MLRNYRAFTMAEAMAAVKRDLGPNAVVLHTRTAAQGGFLGFGRRTVVEVVAAPAETLPAAPARTPTQTKDINAARAQRAYGVPPIATPLPGSAPAGSGQEVPSLDRERTRLLAQAMAVTLERERREDPRSAAGNRATAHAAATTHALERTDDAKATRVARRFVLMPTPRGGAQPQPQSQPAPTPQPDPPPPTVVAPAREDLATIDRLVDDVLRRAAPPASEPEPLAALRAALVDREVGEEFARRITDELRKALSEEDLANDRALRSAAPERIAALLPPCEALGPGPRGWRRGDRPLTVAFIGPTGVGKTTSVAKIAAVLKLRHGARVGLVTCDTYRIAAVDQLRTYAEIIGIPLEVVLSPGRMKQACRRLHELDVILIDTAGRSQKDADRLDELEALMAAAEPHETHLVLSSVASARALEREAAAFAAVGIDKVVLTKLDEAVGVGPALRVLRRIGRSLSYVTTGQEVPQDLEHASPRRLAELLLEEIDQGNRWGGAEDS